MSLRETYRIRTPTIPSLATAVALAAGFVRPVAADIYSWSAGNGSWGSAANWQPAAVPPGDSDIRIGNLVGVQNSTVMMGGPVITVIFDNLEVSDGMTLDLNGSELLSFHEGWITGNNTRVIARPGLAGLNTRDFACDVRIGPGARLELRDNVMVMLGYTGWSEGTISGRGNMLVGGDFRNDGVIDPDANGGLVLDSGQLPADMPVDLDGSSGNGHLLLDTPFSQLTVQALNLTDSFSGTITMAPGALLTTEIVEGWSADGSCLVNVSGNGNPAAASQISGSPLIFAGDLNVGGAEGHLRMLAPTTVQSAAVINIGPTDWVEFAGATVVEDATFSLGTGAKLEFDGVTTVEAGDFETASGAIADGFVAFNGPTEWRGTVDIDGAARQNGPAAVEAPTVINATLFDFTGVNDQTVWDIESSLVINAQDTRGAPSDSFDGVMDIGGSVLSRFTLNLSGGPQVAWSMSGELNLSGAGGTIYLNRVAGALMLTSGEINISDTNVEITADVIAMPTSTFNFAAAGSDLRLKGHTTIREGATFNGQGTMHNGIGGLMTFHNGSSLDEVGLVNQGDLEIRRYNLPNHPGAVLVDRFTNEGTLHVRIGGLMAGDQHDQVQVTDGLTTLAGTLDVSLLDLGGGIFMPVVGQEFTVIRALGGISGTFQNDPESWVDGSRLEWRLVYNPTSVVLRLERIVPPCYANCDNSTASPILNVNDFTCFLNRYAANDAYANCDKSTAAPILNVNDFSCFMNRYAAGCP